MSHTSSALIATDCPWIRKSPQVENLLNLTSSHDIAGIYIQLPSSVSIPTSLVSMLACKVLRIDAAIIMPQLRTSPVISIELKQRETWCKHGANIGCECSDLQNHDEEEHSPAVEVIGLIRKNIPVVESLAHSEIIFAVNIEAIYLRSSKCKKSHLKSEVHQFCSWFSSTFLAIFWVPLKLTHPSHLSPRPSQNAGSHAQTLG